MFESGCLKMGVGRPEIEHLVYRVPPQFEPGRFEQVVQPVMRRLDALRNVRVRVEHPLTELAMRVLTPSSPRTIPNLVSITMPQYDGNPQGLWNQSMNAPVTTEASMTLDRPQSIFYHSNVG